MTVRFTSEQGWYIDHGDASRLVVELATGWHEIRLNALLFDISSPYMMDSQFDKLQQDETDDKPKRNRKKKRKPFQDPFQEYRQTVVADISSSWDRLKAHMLEKHGPSTPAQPTNDTAANNRPARTAALRFQIDDTDFSEFTRLMSLASDQPFNLYDESDTLKTVDPPVVATLIRHNHGECSVVKLFGRDYVLPPDCSFLMSDVRNLQPLLRNGTKFDLVLVDPPWENRSVKRKRPYDTMTDFELYKLPIRTLCAEGALLAVWVTNRMKQVNFLKEALFPHWDVSFVAEWYWLKITTKLEPVCDLFSEHKRPYETLVFGRFKPVDSSYPEVPSKKLIVSVPSEVHSHKPPLDVLLKPFLKTEPKCLEMFARGLRSGWTSWGNEVLKFQDLRYFERRKL